MTTDIKKTAVKKPAAAAKSANAKMKPVKNAEAANTSPAGNPADVAESSAVDSPLYVNSVEKSMRVLMAFDGQQRQLSLSQIAAVTGFDLSTAQRFTSR